MATNSKKLDVSIVIPVMNEEENVPILYRSIVEVMTQWRGTYEIIIIDDGSSDNTFALLRDLAAADPALRVIKFRKNFGQSAAMGAGFLASRGRVIVTLDGDLQNDPRDIPALVAKLHEGYDVVSGWRKNRKDKLIIRKIPSRIANWLIRRTTRVSLHDTGCSLKAYRRELVEKIRLYGEFHRFIPALGRIEGARIAEVVVDHHERRFGQSKYNITRTFRVIMDLTTLNLLLKYLTNPVHFFGGLTILFLTIGSLVLTRLGVDWLLGGVTPEILNVQVSLVFLLMAAGANFLFFGLIAHMVVRTGEKRGDRLFELKKYP